jgi:hypothetical protein
MGWLSMGYWFRMSQSLILTDALFPLDGGRRRKEKEITMGEEGLLEAGPALLAVPQVAAVRCN